MRTDLESVTPELSDTIRTIIDQVMVQVNVCLPAKVVKYYPSTQYADVQVQLKRKYENGDLVPIPVIPNVPIKHPRSSGGQAYVHMPIQKGDDVVLVFSQRSLDNWKTQGGMQDPADRRKFHLSDAFALIGGSAEPDAFQVNDPTAIEIQNQSGKLQLKTDGTVNLGDFSPSKSAAIGESVEARLQKLEQFALAHVHPTAAPGPPSTGTPPFVADPSVVSSTKVKLVP